MWLDEKVIPDQAISKRQISYIKGALIITLKDLEEQAVDWKEIMRILVPANEIVTFKSTRQRFKLKDEDKLKVNLRHLAHYTLAQIACVDDIYNMHKKPKEKKPKIPYKNVLGTK